VSAYAAAGELDKARDLMTRLVDLCSDLGLMAEEYDPGLRVLVGNYPQAFSHLALVGAAMALESAEAGHGGAGKAAADRDVPIGGAHPAASAGER
jgi:GH15 family glucan-1,4-alpha-glucosidase